MKLKDKVAIVTGGYRGIGLAIASKLSTEGAKVVVIDIFKAEDKKKHFKFIKCDVSIQKEVKKAAKEVIDEFKRIDILVNNAGINKDAFITKMNEESWDKVLSVNLKGAFNWVQSVSNKMIDQKYGRIVNISSIAYLGNRGTSNYSASKAGLLGFTRSVALELAPFNITVNSIAPGVIGDTEMFSLLPEKIRNKIVSRIPSKNPGTCTDIANCVSFLVSDDWKYINGQVIHVCGGLSVGYL